MTPETLCPVCGQDNDPSGPGCDCYGTPTWAPYYPSTADLAAFRRRIGGVFSAISPPTDTPRRYDDEARPLFTDPLARPVSGAWADERRNGIGYRMPGHAYDSSLYGPHARREASALRSRAFERSTDCHPEIVGIVGAWSRETREGCPDRFGPMLAAVPWRTGKAPLPPK